MVIGIFKPFAVFCCQPQSQQYIKTVKNLGDAWRTLADKLATESNQTQTVIETTFDLCLKIRRPEDSADPDQISVEMVADECIPSLPEEPRRHYRVFADYGTDFIWRQPDDVRSDEDSHVDSDEVLSTYPSSVPGLYDVWVDTYTDSFRRRCEETQNYSATVFPTITEEVAWNVAGYLLAWRITMGPHIGSLEYAVGKAKYLLCRGEEIAVTTQFLKDQVDLLAQKEPTE
ncbi:hypothetical protein ATEIFO6365_0001054600 [Aspergillus terreus]|uniref:Uncharacterized protein n=1 Tax=Aspergillus terreus TaxID=33178 RepID=A0A5M3YMU8_ASPTE|nr:hypothetical protein ATETN484_0001046700 [Aspergillus terreus]GFF12323.1 hypothetical protein ATEIFO6365_0001054600 [Aspergillus terreus]